MAIGVGLARIELDREVVPLTELPHHEVPVGAVNGVLDRGHVVLPDHQGDDAKLLGDHLRRRLHPATRRHGDEQERVGVGDVGCDRGCGVIVFRGGAVGGVGAGDLGDGAAGADVDVEHGLVERDAAAELQLSVVSV